jgi:hypothetical protein
VVHFSVCVSTCESLAEKFLDDVQDEHGSDQQSEKEGRIHLIF